MELLPSSWMEVGKDCALWAIDFLSRCYKMTDSFSLVYTPVFILLSSSLPYLLFLCTLVYVHNVRKPHHSFAPILSTFAPYPLSWGQEGTGHMVQSQVDAWRTPCKVLFFLFFIFFSFFHVSVAATDLFWNAVKERTIHFQTIIILIIIIVLTVWTGLSLISCHWTTWKECLEKKKTLSVYFYIWCNIENVLYSGAENDPLLFSVNLNGF